jgi:hypothetical protein
VKTRLGIKTTFFAPFVLEVQKVSFWREKSTIVTKTPPPFWISCAGPTLGAFVQFVFIFFQNETPRDKKKKRGLGEGVEGVRAEKRLQTVQMRHMRNWH